MDVEHGRSAGAWIAWLALLASLLLARTCSGGDTIVLRSRALVEPGRAITLADVAELSGPEAERHARAKVGPALGGAAVKIDVAEVRRSLGSAGVRWGSVSLSGHVCVVEAGTPSARHAKRPAGERLEKADGPVVRDHAVRRIAAMLEVPPEDVRLSTEGDEPLLEMPTSARVVAITPGGRSARIPLEIKVYEGGGYETAGNARSAESRARHALGTKLIAEGTVRVGVEVRRRVMVTRGALARGERILASAVAQEDRWIAPTLEPVAVDEVVGAAARGAIDAGKIVLARDVETPAVVRKGDLLAVDAVVGGVVVRMNNARALGDARAGDEVLVEQSASLAGAAKAEGRRGRPGTVRVRVVGPGRATAVGE